MSFFSHVSGLTLLLASIHVQAECRAMLVLCRGNENNQTDYKMIKKISITISALLVGILNYDDSLFDFGTKRFTKPDDV